MVSQVQQLRDKLKEVEAGSCAGCESTVVRLATCRHVAGRSIVD